MWFKHFIEFLFQFIFGMVSYFVICIQFRLTFLAKSSALEKLLISDNQTRIA